MKFRWGWWRSSHSEERLHEELHVTDCTPSTLQPANRHLLTCTAAEWGVLNKIRSHSLTFSDGSPPYSAAQSQKRRSVLYDLHLLLTPVASSAAKSTRTLDLEATLLRQQNRKEHMMDTYEGIQKNKTNKQKNIFINKTEKTAPAESACENKGWMNDKFCRKANMLSLEHPLPIPIVSLFDKCSWLWVRNTMHRALPLLSARSALFILIYFSVRVFTSLSMYAGQKKANIHECIFLCAFIFLQTGAEEPFN